MGKSLIIVESPAKTRTLKNFLGPQYRIEASMGHVRDLPKKDFAVDVENDFAPTYEIIPDRKDTLKRLREAVKESDEIYLASDPDREGEAIAWHLQQALKLKSPKRIEFNEITRQAVTHAIEKPRVVDMNRVNAQQARRVLDRLVGYKLSPLLWQKVKKNLSAGRVQSVAVRLICDREREISAFVPEEYWSIVAKLTPKDRIEQFEAKLAQINGDKAEISNETEGNAILRELEGANYVVGKITEKEQRRNPAAPFITSTMQQEAARKLGFSAKRTMMNAQHLYEGIELGAAGHVGLITYMRTDSTRVAAEAQQEAREYIEKTFGKDYVPAKPRQVVKKGAQDAHEAIRPTSVMRHPDEMAQFLSRDQARLYKLIWQRFVASQMNPAVFDVITVDIKAGRFTFRAAGSTLKFAGFKAVYTEGRDTAEVIDEERPPLPKLSINEDLRLIDLVPDQHFTEPPPRYTEATLVKALEEKGIGRPSTYATIISTIQDRNYVVLEEKKFKPTELGFTVTDYLVQHFPRVLDVQFTANVETELDDVEEGKMEWHKLLRDFYGPFDKALEQAQWGPEGADRTCPNCGKKMVVKQGRFGPFLGCSGYPECRTIIKVEREKLAIAEPKETDIECPNCGRKMLLREGRMGEFLGCSGYPECKTTMPVEKKVGVKCPTCGEGEIVEKISRKRKVFYGCNRYPQCTFVSWGKPIDRRCPQCGFLLAERRWKGRLTGYKCISAECGYEERAARKKEESEDQFEETQALAS
ncbi:MAG: type I DNA topoisomerase [Armatimonadetes bacterium]|nr:type I DNA topoisomerase [Armatimonadota bacterium]